MEKEYGSGYTGPYFYADTTYYYIHKHLQDLGRAAGGQRLADADLYARFQAHKEQAIAASKTQYKDLMKNSMTPESIQLINAAFEEDGSSIMLEINKQMEERLKESLNINKMQELMGIQKKVSSNSIGQTLKDGKGSDAAEAFDKLLTALSDAMRLIGGPQSDNIAKALLAQKYGETVKINPGIERMGNRLLKALSIYSKAADMTTIEMQRVDQAVQSINTLATALKDRKTSKGEKITANAIKNMIDNIFSTGFAEGIASMIDNSAQFAVNQSLIRLTGSDTTQIQITDPSGKPLSLEGTKRAGKADIQAKNVKISLDAQNDIDGGEIIIDIGISNKFYRTQGFTVNGKSAKGLTISSGSGGTVKEAINSLFGSPTDKYLAYNIMAKGDQLPQATMALNDLFLSRQINRLFASRGGSIDFAQFILANGEIVSIWELILYAERFSVGLSNSMIRKQKRMGNDPNQALVLSISDRKDILNAGSLEDTYRRITETNQAISKATIQAHLHIDKLRKMIN
jgi:lambda repressor-like predicted transcriptional regulator